MNRPIARLAIAGSAMLILSGCASYFGDGVGEIRRAPSPGIKTLYERGGDMQNAMTVMADENWRMFTEDLGRAFYWDRPSRLTPEPIPR